jgi:hypothetical protein
MGKKKTTVYLDEDVLRSARVAAARQGCTDSELLESALRSYLGMDLLDRAWSRSELSEEDAMHLALEEIRAYRAGK